jgi:uncharacterized LabA/DUF88 family protein
MTSIYKGNKAGILIDGSNTFWQVMKFKGYRIDYTKATSFVRNFFGVETEFCKYYGAYNKENKKQEDFHNILIKSGVELVLDEIRIVGCRVHGDMDYKIKEEIKRCAYDPKIAYIVIFSGDKHFIPEYKECLDQNKHVKIFSFRNNISDKIKKLTDTYGKAHYVRLNKQNIRKELEYIKNIKKPAEIVKTSEVLTRDIG